MSAVNRYLSKFYRREKCGNAFVVVGWCRKGSAQYYLATDAQGPRVNASKTAKSGQACYPIQCTAATCTFNAECVISISTSSQEAPPREAPKSESSLVAPSNSTIDKYSSN